MQILKKYEELGVKEVWLTPHIMEDIPNTTAHLKERFNELQAAYQGHVTLHLASENMLDNLFEERLEKNDLLPIGEHKDHLLVETSYFNPPMGLYDILQRIKAKGYYPILAHPERYMYMEEGDYDRLREHGIEFQLNLMSLAGTYGQLPYEKAHRMLDEGYYKFVGSDYHRRSVYEGSLRHLKLTKKQLDKLKILLGNNDDL